MLNFTYLGRNDKWQNWRWTLWQWQIDAGQNQIWHHNCIEYFVGYFHLLSSEMIPKVDWSFRKCHSFYSRQCACLVPNGKTRSCCPHYGWDRCWSGVVRNIHSVCNPEHKQCLNFFLVKLNNYTTWVVPLIFCRHFFKCFWRVSNFSQHQRRC